MAFSPSSPLVGTTDVTITGFTSPTYTLTQDTAPSANGKQYTVSALGGTQTGVTVHSVGSPFTLSCFRPVSPKTLAAANPLSGVVRAVGKNKYTLITRKGMTPYANAAIEVGTVRTEINIPAGTDTYDVANVKAAIAAHIMMLQSVADGLCTTVQTGVL